MNHTKIFNIETVADQALPKELLPSISDYDQYKKETTKMEHLQEDMKKLALSPLTGNIICLSWVDVDDENLKGTYHSEDEKGILSAFASDVLVDPAVKLVGFNSHSFDMPFLAVKLAIYGIPVRAQISNMLQRYNSAWHVDIREMLSNYDTYKKGKLSQWAARFGLNEIFGEGANIQQWFDEGEWKAITRHCESNVDATRQLFIRIKDIYRL